MAPPSLLFLCLAPQPKLVRDAALDIAKRALHCSTMLEINGKNIESSKKTIYKTREKVKDNQNCFWNSKIGRITQTHLLPPPHITHDTTDTSHNSQYGRRALPNCRAILTPQRGIKEGLFKSIATTRLSNWIRYSSPERVLWRPPRATVAKRSMLTTHSYKKSVS